MPEFLKNIVALFNQIQKILKHKDIGSFPEDKVIALKSLRDELLQLVEIHKDRKKLSSKDQKVHAKLVDIYLEYQRAFEPIYTLIEEDDDPSEKEIKAIDKLDLKLKRFLKIYIKSSTAIQEVLSEEKEYLQKLNDLILTFKEEKISPIKDLSNQEDNPELTKNAIKKASAAYKDVTQYEVNAITDLFKKGRVTEVDADVEIHHTDVEQGYLGDCYFLAALGAVAKANPDAIRELIVPKDDGTYDVKLYLRKKKFLNWSGLSPIIVNVTPEIPVVDDTSSWVNEEPVYAKEGDLELWVTLVEKAYAKLNGTEKKSKYKKIEGGYGHRGIESITGHQAKKFNPKRRSKPDLITIIQNALTEERAITVATRFKLIRAKKRWVLADGTEIYGLHEYYVLSINQTKIELRNPHGVNSYVGGNIFTLSLDDFLDYYNAVSIEI